MLVSRRALASDRVELVDEDDGRRRLACCRKQLANSSSSDSNVPVRIDLSERPRKSEKPGGDLHLIELASRGREEVDSGFSSNCTSQQCLAGSRRSCKKHATRQAPAELFKLLWILEELNDLVEFMFCFLDAVNVLQKVTNVSKAREARAKQGAHFERGATTRSVIGVRCRRRSERSRLCRSTSSEYASRVKQQGQKRKPESDDISARFRRASEKCDNSQEKAVQQRHENKLQRAHR